MPEAASQEGADSSRARLSSEFSTGDFTLVSSNNVAFRIDSRVLVGASGVLRDMCDVSSTQKSITLVDPDFETSSVVRQFLRILTTGRITLDSGLSYVLPLLRFCEKYDCTLALRLVKSLLQNEIARGSSKTLPEAFCVGVAMDDMELIAATIARSADVAKELPQLSALPSPTPAAKKHRDTRANAAAAHAAAPKTAVHMVRTGGIAIHDLPPASWCNWGPPVPEYLWALYHVHDSVLGLDSTVKLTPSENFRLHLESARTSSGHSLRGPTVHPDWSIGTCELLSADNELFRIETYHILAASPVLRDRLAPLMDAPNPRRITFTDADTEHSQIILSFLNLITTGYPCISYHPESARAHARRKPVDPNPRHLELLVFLRRYQCTVGLACLRQYYEAADRVGSISNLLINLIIDDRPNTSRIFQLGLDRDQVWQRQPDSPLADQSLCRTAAFDPRSWPYSVWKLLPAKPLLSYCYAIEMTRDHGSSDWPLVAEFMADMRRRLDKEGG